MSTLPLLPSKFLPYIINRPEWKDPVGEEGFKQNVINAFQQGLSGRTELAKAYVFTLPNLEGWIVKGPRMCVATTADTHLHRVRKATKIEQLIKKYQLEQLLVVPKKFLYFDSLSQVWYVLSRKLTLSSKVPSLKDIAYWQTPGISADLARLTPDDQTKFRKALSGDPQSTRSISVEQARGLTILCYEAGLTDLTYKNLMFDAQEKIAIVDTEPQKRYFKQAPNKNLFFKIFVDHSVVNFTQSIVGSAKLKSCLDLPQAVQIVNRLENYYLSVFLMQSVAKLALSYGIWLAVNRVTFAALRIAIKVCVVIKVVYFVPQNINTLVAFLFNKKGGVNSLANAEKNGEL
jgi:hypothetical protein